MEFSGQYLTYNEYKVLGGTLTTVPFNLAEFRARKRIDEETDNRLVSLETQAQEVKTCIYDLILLQISINNGVEQSGNAINYSSDEIRLQELRIIKNNLSKSLLEDGTPYLYRGIEYAS